MGARSRPLPLTLGLVRVKLKLSQFSHVFPSPTTEDVVALWHALTMELCFIDKGLSNRLLLMRSSPTEQSAVRDCISGSDEQKNHALNQLLSAKILVPLAEQESEYPLFLARKMEESRFVGVLYLILFDGCNFSCQYCFENNRQPEAFRPRSMSREVARAAIELFARLSVCYPPPASHEPKVQLYGGEPMLNWDVFQFSVDYFNELKHAKRIDSRVGLATVTNGTDMSEDRAAFIAANGISIGVSLDGPKMLNDRYRKSNCGIDAFDIALSALKILREAGAKVGVSVTLTPDVVDNFSEVLGFLQSEVGVDRGLGFNILHPTTTLPVHPDYYAKAASCIIKAFQTFRDAGVWEDRAMRKVVAFVDQHPLHADCAAVGHQIVISPEGSVGICQDYIKDRTGFCSTVFDSSYDPFTNDLFSEWSKRTPFRMKKCYGCPALAICGGGCPAAVEAQTGSIWNVDTRICEHSLQMLNFLVWDTYARQRAG